MLGLVDYEGSDSEEEEFGNKEEQIETINMISQTEGLNVNENSVSIKSKVEDQSLLDDELGNLLDSLPSASNPEVKVGPLITEDTLEDLVKRKEWEVKEAEKRKRKLEKLRKKEIRRARRRETKDKISNETVVKKKIKIEAFGELNRIDKSSDDEDKGDGPDNIVRSQSIRSKALLSLLPKPKVESNRSKLATIMLPASLNQQKKPNIGNEKAGIYFKNEIRSSIPGDQDDSEGEDNVDFFGLNNTETVDCCPETKISAVPYGPSKLSSQSGIPSYDSQPINSSTDIFNEVGPSSSGIINDSEAARIIYSHDVAPYGGSENDANDAVNNIVDVNVDQALGSNIRANLLKNLHNKSLAEAAISHLARIPKPKDAKDAVARRKHQITYLATVAVAREEQLAEQWSQNRHAKRMAAQKYGF